jgi:hypothetical protein
MATIDFAKSLKDLYTAKTTVKDVNAGPGVFLAVDGQGAPGKESFQEAIRNLFNVVYTVKFACKHGGDCDFKVSKLECVYLSDPAATPMDQWQWRLLIRIPDDVSAKHVNDAKRTVKEKKGFDVANVKRLRWKEGPALQVLHVGPYDKVGVTCCQLGKFAESNGWSMDGPPHEIYISDPRMTAPERLKTIVRLGVKKPASGKKK